MFIGVDPTLRQLRGNAALRSAAQAGGVAHGFSTAYSVDMIGTVDAGARGAPDDRACSASTSIRLPCDRSISSDDRIVPGMPAT